MHLKRLRLKGFKSFPLQTELLFEPGVAVVIGPNGSGKSNLADAVVWALGEQSPSTMRGSSMQDVIFAGSDGRRASGLAEVELTFDNADGALPLPTPEVSVMRSVSREGGSQYFINRSSCRLTDVVELMAQVGLGKELHSIIGQGKVEGFLAGRPEDRRSQIEEAAGLGTFKRRRERADLKLREVRRNLERAELVEREVGAQLSPLRRQANAAEELRSVDNALAEIRGRLLSGEIAALDAEQARWRAELDSVRAERASCELGLAEVADARAREEEAFARRLAERERRAQRVLRVKELAGRVEGSRRLAEQRLRLLGEVARASSAERQRLVADLTARPDPAEDSAWASDEERLAADLRSAEDVYAGAVAGLSTARDALAEQRSVASRLTLEMEAGRATAARLERRLQALDGEEARLVAQHAALEAEAAEKSGAETAAEAAAVSGRETLREAARAAEKAAASLAEAAYAADAVADEVRAHLNERRALEAEVEHVRVAMRELQDVGDDVLRVAESYEGAVSLAAALGCEPGYERALAAALAQVSGALAVPAGVDRWSLLSALKTAGVGLARLVSPVRRPRPHVGFPGALPLLDKVHVEERSELESALAEVVIVDDLRSVPEEFGGLAVTREGEYCRPSSGQLGLASGVPAALMLERRASLARLEEQLEISRSRELRAEALLASARDREAEAAKTAAEAAAAERAARAAAESAERELHAVRARLQDLSRVVERDGRALEQIAAERGELAAQLTSATESSHGASARLAEHKAQLDAAVDALAAAERVHAEALAARTRLAVELDERRAAAERARARKEEALRRAAATRARLEELDARLASLPAVEEICGSVEARASRLSRRLAELVTETEAADTTCGSLDRAELGALADREAGLRHALEALAGRDTEAQVALARLEDRRGEHATALDEVCAVLERASFEAPADDAEEGALRERLERLARRRERIGPVNPLAEAECAELSERAAFLREQRRDLEKSLADLQGLIKDLTAQIDAEFAETFAAVKEQFVHMVSVLFPGGRGALKLVEPGDDGEPGGVEVEVKPAKKLGKKLQLLSGGERALVAIAFLMALVLARPCPFYILDEIEAALDDVNIGRLVQLLRDYRERTQFIIVTHQKRTMEAADVLYGVTMGGDGASQVVSARMAAEAIAREQGAAGSAG